MNKNFQVIKRNGHKDRLYLDKIHRVVTWAAEELDHLSVSRLRPL